MARPGATFSSPASKDPTGSEISWQQLASTEAHDKIGAVLKKLSQKELLYGQFSPFHLKRELERHLWGQNDHVSTGAVATAFDTYLFLPRLFNPDLLAEAIRNAFNGSGLLCDFFRVCGRI